MNPLSQLRKATPLILITLACIGLLPGAKAVSPAPDGGYPGYNTAEGQSALFNLNIAGGGIWNTALGGQALFHDTTGNSNTAVGVNALLNNTTGNSNVAIGVNALKLDTTGGFNTAVGVNALYNNTGTSNTAIGVNALIQNTTGIQNVATGQGALARNTTGGGNTATGSKALQNNTTGVGNTAIGIAALLNSTTGDDNTASGNSALIHNTTGYANTAIAWRALLNNTTGDGNTAIGVAALQNNVGAFNNTASGNAALYNNINGGYNTASGYHALFNSTGNSNIALGVNAGESVTSASNVIAIGAPGANVSNTCFIGNIRGVSTHNANAIPVVIDSNGQLGTVSSSRRFKKEIKPMDKASEAILALKPVTFHYQRDATDTPQFGLIAEEVAEVNPDLVVRDNNREIYTVRYEAVNAMLLNEFLKEHRKVEEQGAIIAKQQKQIEALTAGLQKVSDQLDLTRPAPQTVFNDQ